MTDSLQPGTEGLLKLVDEAAVREICLGGGRARNPEQETEASVEVRRKGSDHLFSFSLHRLAQVEKLGRLRVRTDDASTSH